MLPGKGSEKLKLKSSSSRENVARSKGVEDETKNTASNDNIPVKQVSVEKDKRSTCLNAEDPSQQSIRLRSASRDSINDDPRSLVDSISGTSVRQNWSGKELAEEDPSISSIKGDSISATIADYNRKYRAQTSDSQSGTSGARLNNNGACGGGESSPKTNDDLSSNINFYAACGSSSGIVNQASGSGSMKPADFVSVSSNANMDAFDIIEESSNVSSNGDLSQSTSNHRNNQQIKLHQQHHNQKKHGQTRSSVREQALDFDDLPQEASVYQIEPIILRGNGNLTLFGLSNSFSSEFPSALIGRVSREEFERTMRRVNTLLRDQQSLSAKLLLFGGLCCCCSLGFSLVWPSIALKKRSKMSLEKFLANENSRLYSKLGLNWKLAEQRCYSNHAFVEYVLMIEFTPKINLYLPD